MLKDSRRSTAFRTAVLAPLLLLALTACGGSSDATATPEAAATGAPGSNGQGSEGGSGFGGADSAAIQACLKAAGVSIPTPSDRPSGGPGPSGQARPSGTFNGTPPADGVRPSGGAGRGGGFGGGLVQSAEAQAALKACGIAVPTGRGNLPSATPTG